MTAAAKRILDEALSLSDEERMELMVALRDSFEPAAAKLSPERKAEIDRIAQVERGDVEPVVWDEVEAKVQAALARR